MCTICILCVLRYVYYTKVMYIIYYYYIYIYLMHATLCILYVPSGYSLFVQHLKIWAGGFMILGFAPCLGRCFDSLLRMDRLWRKGNAFLLAICLITRFTSLLTWPIGNQGLVLGVAAQGDRVRHGTIVVLEMPLMSLHGPRLRQKHEIPTAAARLATMSGLHVRL